MINNKGIVQLLHTVIYNMRSAWCTFLYLRRIEHGTKCKCNAKCRFTNKTYVGNNCHFNGLKIYGNGMVSIGSNFHSGVNIKILTDFHNYDEGMALPYDAKSISKDVTIEDNVWLGDDIIILGGVRIGEGAVIQAGSVVCKNIPPLAVAGGHPAVPFKYRDKEHYYKLKEQNKYF